MPLWGVDTDGEIRLRDRNTFICSSVSYTSRDGSWRVSYLSRQPPILGMSHHRDMSLEDKCLSPQLLLPNPPASYHAARTTGHWFPPPCCLRANHPSAKIQKDPRLMIKLAWPASWSQRSLSISSILFFARTWLPTSPGPPAPLSALRMKC